MTDSDFSRRFAELKRRRHLSHAEVDPYQLAQDAVDLASDLLAALRAREDDLAMAKEINTALRQKNIRYPEIGGGQVTARSDGLALNSPPPSAQATEPVGGSPSLAHKAIHEQLVGHVATIRAARELTVSEETLIDIAKDALISLKLKEMRASPPPSAPPEPIATLHSDGCWSWKQGKLQAYEEGVEWAMDVYEMPPSAEDCSVVAPPSAPAGWQELIAAARAVIERWDSPTWKDLPHTGESIARLRRAVDAALPAASEET